VPFYNFHPKTRPQFSITHTVNFVCTTARLMLRSNVQYSELAHFFVTNEFSKFFCVIKISSHFALVWHLVWNLYRHADWLMVTMETSSPLIEMDYAVIDKGTEEQLVGVGINSFACRLF